MQDAFRDLRSAVLSAQLKLQKDLSDGVEVDIDTFWRVQTASEMMSAIQSSLYRVNSLLYEVGALRYSEEVSGSEIDETYHRESDTRDVRLQLTLISEDRHDI